MRSKVSLIIWMAYIRERDEKINQMLTFGGTNLKNFLSTTIRISQLCNWEQSGFKTHLDW